MNSEPETRDRPEASPPQRRSDARAASILPHRPAARTWTAWSIALSMMLALLVAAPTTASAAPAPTALSAELVDNGTFGSGASGWRTNGNAQRLTVTSDQHARLTTSTNSGVVLNDAENTVTKAKARTTYVVRAQVRSTSPTVNGALRVREVANGQVVTHRSTFSLDNTQWKSVDLTFTTSLANPALDLNVLAWDLQRGDDLRIDNVSMKSSTGGPIPVDPIDPAPIPRPRPEPCRSNPSTDTKFGASIYPVGKTPQQALAETDAAFGRMPVVRDFYPGMPPAWNSSRAQLLRDREVVISFKASPSAILSGQHDRYLRNWFATAPNGQTIYWSYMHEPEVKVKGGQFTPAQYRRAWQHIDELADESCKPNMHATLILTAWTIDPRSGRDYRDYDPGRDVAEVIAFDPYNHSHNAGADYYMSAEDMLGPLAETMEADGRPWGIAEIGSRIVVGDDGRGRAAWLTDVGEFLIEHDASFATYFHVDYEGKDWRLNDAHSRRAWGALVRR